MSLCNALGIPRRLTIAEAAEITRLSPKTLRNRIYQRRLPATKHAGRLMIDVADVRALMGLPREGPDVA